MIDEILNIINLNSFEEIIRIAFSFICHQDEFRLLTIYGNSLPLCPRCMGLQIGFFSVVTALVFINRTSLLILKKIPRIILIVLITMAGIHWLGGAFKLFNTNSFVKISAGFISGSSFGFFLYTRTTCGEVNIARMRSLIKIISLAIIILLIITLIAQDALVITFTLGLIVFLNLSILLKVISSIILIPIKNYHQLIKQEVSS